MASRCGKGEIFLLVFLSFVAVSAAEADGGGVPALLDRQEEQLNKLQDLVDTLSRTVARLESVAAVPDGSPARLGGVEVGSVKLDRAAVPEGVDGRRRAVGGISVTKGKPLWLEKFQFLAAARLEAEATCAFVLPYVDHDGLSKYFALGDSQGRIFVFSSAGDVLVESLTPTGSPVTVMLSYLSIRKNESLLFSGHADGSVVGHRVWESAANGDDWLTVSIGAPRVLFRGGEPESPPPVAILEVHQIGRVRYVVSSDEAGRIRVFTENGTLYGTTAASGRPLAFMRQRMLFLTESGTGWLDLRRMAVRETECEGLNGSVAKSFAFDVSERSKAYGFTSGGDLIHVVLLGDAANIKCRVRAVKKSDIDGPVSVLAIKGYLLVVSNEKLFLYNVSSQYYSRIGASRPVFFATLAELKSLFLNSQDSIDGPAAVGGKPLIAGDREKLVVLGLGDGYVGIYRSNFPVFKAQSNAVLWSSPALLFLMFLIGMWYLYVKKKGSMGWTHDESFAAPAGAAASSGLLGPVAGDRAFADSQRAGDLRDVRGGMLRGPTRRYASPSSRYSGGTGLPYRPTSTDPGFGGAAELKYRSQAAEPPGFAKRREPIYANNQVLDDHID